MWIIYGISICLSQHCLSIRPDICSFTAVRVSCCCVFSTSLMGPMSTVDADVVTGVVSVVGSGNRKFVAIVLSLLWHCKYSYNWSLTKAHETLHENVVPSGTRSTLHSWVSNMLGNKGFLFWFVFLQITPFLHDYTSNTYTSLISITEVLSYPGIYSRKHLYHIKIQMLLRENTHTSDYVRHVCESFTRCVKTTFSTSLFEEFTMEDSMRG